MPNLINDNDPKMVTVSEIAATIKKNTGDESLRDTRNAALAETARTIISDIIATVIVNTVVQQSANLSLRKKSWTLETLKGSYASTVKDASHGTM